jgi:predicted amidohydrolase YtcJ
VTGTWSDELHGGAFVLIDTTVENARIRTLDPARPAATRLGSLHGRIIGLDEELDGVRARHVHDLGGAAVLPGFHDAHQHLSKRGQRAVAAPAPSRCP